ncbi:hypothetical protein BRM22_15140 [Xanthomonas oryzae pv. oryzae]|uniref:Uncharacterized protein n=1 Tax=Xanthomonas oryzae pv. oryzae TaxID=64187 RepID=A0A854CM79_XANOO|nr:hypothetical protein [Xanthomonas oryzae]OLG44274.1 hypothetical protein BXO25_14335 [Xanthomonas oryzae pv. oryzae]OLG44747.1 hypothetical protein BXO33_11070 [Xanthomonas oryzae pv. oryzae]OLG63923.1 hypothetical protein BXO439_16135 [Xanthomonas oryzae pv. oryzae]OLG74755.1 hypothetical protein BXO554_01560 [Xanthomonas oryzae pv. oryzae]OLG75885.1 hypothetical protein BXO454_11365 [Xanthomonas oryzae pv. oryzae]
MSETGHHSVVSNPSGRLPAPARRSWPAAAINTLTRESRDLLTAVPVEGASEASLHASQRVAPS